MKTKVYVELLPKSEKNIVAEVVLEKSNHDEASGTLKYTRLNLEFDERITMDELDAIATEREDYKIVFNKSQIIRTIFYWYWENSSWISEWVNDCTRNF